MSVATKPLTDFASEQQRRFDALVPAEQRKVTGHFGTPAVIAEFMAGMFSQPLECHLRILDAGAGVGTLSVAVCQRLLEHDSPLKLHFELWENDQSLVPLLRQSLTHCQQALCTAGHKLTFAIRDEDFILSNGEESLFDNAIEPSFHWAILNPPYFKLRKDSAQARAMAHVVHGQPNIYALFMARAAELLLPGGEMVAITPRSYFNGPYFKRFRKWYFDRMSVRQVHVFESRTEAFKSDAVLQENVILHAEKGATPRDILLTSSTGRDLMEVQQRRAMYDTIIDNSNGDHVVRVTSNRMEHEIVAAMDKLPCRFRDLGFEISTGPVVGFRAVEFLRDVQSATTAPLLWMHNVRPFVTPFPRKNGKQTHIEVSNASKRLLVPARNYVLLKRFTSKEEKRRLVAGVFTPQDSYSEWVGLENHLNYVYRAGSELSQLEVFGLAAFFNSAFVDQYFRAISGNTQVNATEIRSMPFPDQATIESIGQQILQLSDKNPSVVERIVGATLALPGTLVNELIETTA
ncbi:MAG: Eco57I restriction-modification methylase domain-containing protein [Planctomycetota bacterium]|nr:Eco57I restriction-modification methylase domain-containing protein [Planctomycetota bacterium]